MPDTEILDQSKVEQTEQPRVKLSSIGKPERVNVNVNKISDQVQNTLTKTNSEGANATPSANEVVSEIKTETTAPDIKDAITDEKVKEYFKSLGIDYESAEKLKEKLNHKPEDPITEEQKAEIIKAKEKRLVDKFVSGGGTVEQYVAIKSVAEANVSELSLSNLKIELKTAGFTDEQATEIIKERYFQIADEELEQFSDETDREYAKRKKEFGAKKLENHSLHTKKQAEQILADLNGVIDSEDLQKQAEADISSKIDEGFKSLPRKLTFEIGDINGKAIPPVEYEVSESDIAEVQSMLKDTSKRNKLLYNQDGSLNLTNLTNVYTRNKYLESAIKAAYHEGGSRQKAEIEKIFPSKTGYALGVGGSPSKPTGEKPKVAGFGKTQKISRHQQN